ncbi:MAG: hypothetical protein JWQ52_1777 [Phenylobacterium sp.]|jgi:hypothetical protein|nr:hypothetical protein [Phenylobacterium sp.]
MRGRSELEAGLVIDLTERPFDPSSVGRSPDTFSHKGRRMR